MTEWETPGGQKMVPKDEASNDSMLIEIAMSVCAVMIVATGCALALHFAGLI